jgi:hypothetical protein
MRYVVLLRYGLWRLRVVMKVLREADGSVWCAAGTAPFAGVTWRMGTLDQPYVAFSIPGPELLDERLYTYDSIADKGATVQVSAYAVLEEPHRVALQLVMVPRGQEPYHRETVGDRRIDDGDPAMWVVLARSGEDPGERLAAQRIRRWPPPLRVAIRE